MSSQLVSNLTVDELKDVIASVVDNRLDNLLRLLSKDFAIKAADLKTVPNPCIAESTKYLAEYKSELKKDNPWLKIAGMHKHNPLFEEVVASIQSNHQEYPDEELS